MSSINGSFVPFAAVKPPEAGWTSRSRQIIIASILTLIVLGGGALIAVNQYASAREELLEATAASANRFETVFFEVSTAKQQALRLGVEIMAHDTDVANALRLRDRAALAAHTVPLFDQVLKPRFGATVLDFPAADGVMFFRAHRPTQFGDDVSGRAMVATTLKQRISTSGLEIGRSGPELRAMAPVIVGDALAGATEIGSSVDDALRAGYRATGLAYGFALNRQYADGVQDLQHSAVLTKNDQFYLSVSGADILSLLEAAPFDPVSAAPAVVRVDGQEVFVQSFPVEDFARRPVTVVTVVRNLTESLRSQRNGILILTSAFTLLALGAILIGLFQFQNLRTRLERSLAGRLHDLREKASAYDRVSQSLRDVQAWKLGFIHELVILIKDPLVAVTSMLEADAGDQTPPEALNELRRLSFAVQDQATLVSLRDGLVRAEPARVDLAALANMIARQLGEDLPVSVEIASNLGPVAGTQSTLTAALRALTDLVQRAATSAVTIGAEPVDRSAVGWVAGPGSWRGARPTVDEAGVFAASLNGERDSAPALAAAVLARFGGSLGLLEETGMIGFTFTLPLAE